VEEAVWLRLSALTAVNNLGEIFMKTRFVSLSEELKENFLRSESKEDGKVDRTDLRGEKVCVPPNKAEAWNLAGSVTPGNDVNWRLRASDSELFLLFVVKKLHQTKV
jgi:hypothetical protein